MNWTFAITRNRDALLRIVAALCVMAGLGEGDTLETLPRHLRNHLYRILRPAESAVRRLIVMTVARATLSPGGVSSGRQSRPIDNDLSIGAPNARSHGGGPKANPSPSLPLFDPLKRFDAGKKYSKSFPRISFIGVTDPCPLPPVLTPDDPVSAERLGRRLAALQRALDDLDGQAKRYARWRARKDMASGKMQDGFASVSAPGQRLAAYDKENQQRLAAYERKTQQRLAAYERENQQRPIHYVREGTELKDVKQRQRKLTPFRPGWPPGYRKRPIHPVDDVLRDCHSLALMAINPPSPSRPVFNGNQI